MTSPYLHANIISPFSCTTEPLYRTESLSGSCASLSPVNYSRLPGYLLLLYHYPRLLHPARLFLVCAVPHTSRVHRGDSDGIRPTTSFCLRSNISAASRRKLACTKESISRNKQIRLHRVFIPDTAPAESLTTPVSQHSAKHAKNIHACHRCPPYQRTSPNKGIAGPALPYREPTSGNPDTKVDVQKTEDGPSVIFPKPEDGSPSALARGKMRERSIISLVQSENHIFCFPSRIVR